MERATFIIPNEMVEVVSQKADRYGSITVKILHFDGRISEVPRSALLFKGDEELLQELARLVSASRNLGRSKRYFEIMKELVKRQAPASMLQHFVEQLTSSKPKHRQLSLEDVI